MQEFQGDLGHDALQLPDGRLVQRFDLVLAFCRSLEFWAQLGVQDLPEERCPRCQLSLLEQIGTDDDLKFKYVV